MPAYAQQGDNSPILIVGYMHSGTTLLQQILGRHPDLFISGGETRFFMNLSTTARIYPDLDDDQTLRGYLEYLLKVIFTGYADVNFTSDVDYTPVRLQDYGISKADLDDLFQEAQANRSHTALYAITFDYLARKQGKKRWLDKLPGYVSQVERMMKVLPDSQIIELIRDPRDILASKKRRAASRGSYDPIWDSLAWKTAVRAGAEAQQKAPARYLRLRYEDLVSNPEEAARKVCTFLDMQFSVEMLSVGWINSTTVQGQQSASQIGTAAIGKWRRILPAAHAAACQRVTKNELQINNYDIESVSPSTYLALPFLAVRSGAEFFLRLYRKWRRGGPDLVRNVVKNYRMRLLRLIQS